MVNTIGVIGGGVVGRATARSFVEWAEVRVYDADRARRTHPLNDALGCDVVFVCLPEAAVVPFFNGLTGPHREDRNYVIKSTVPVGTTRRVYDMGFRNAVHSPEFLTARCAVTDAQLPARNVIGTPGGRAVGYDGTGCWKVLRDLYRDRFTGVPVLMMESETSELLKLVQNSFFAVKVAFFNEAREVCDKLGLDWDDLVRALLADGRIAHSHTRVPGPDGKFGFGGACLPKDLAQFVGCCREAGTWPAVSLAAAARNATDRDRGEK